MVKSLIVVGCGSIGQRHAKNAKLLGVKDIILCDTDETRMRKFGDSIGTDLLFKSYEKAFASHSGVEAAIIATPSGMHLQPAAYLAGHGVNILIEKPLSDSLGGTAKLVALIRKRNIIGMMGQSYRFHEGFLALKSILASGGIGKVLHVSYLSGQYLPDWHPGTDYRKEYAAQKKLGGGVLLTSMSHGFDIVQWLFGDITEISGWKTKLGSLDMDVEDSFFCLLRTDKNVIVQCQSDFLQRDSRHQMTIIGEKGHIEADFIKNQIRLWTIEKQETQITNYQFDPNKRYVEELRHFFNLISEKKIDHDLNITVGRRVLELIMDKNITQI